MFTVGAGKNHLRSGAIGTHELFEHSECRLSLGVTVERVDNEILDSQLCQLSFDLVD
jgi:hypothetical protein